MTTLKKKINNLLFKVDTSLLRKTGFFLSRPKFIILELTNACNLHCSFCLKSTSPSINKLIPKGFMTLETIRNALLPIKDYVEVIGLNGFGESTLHPNFEVLLKEVRNICPNTIISFHTNGTLLTQELIDILYKYHIESLSISLDAVDTKSYGWVHNKETGFNNVIQNIKKLVAYKKEKRYNLELTISYTLIPQNVNLLPDFVRLASKLGVDAVGPIHVMNELWNNSKYENKAIFLKNIEKSLKNTRQESIKLKIPLIETNLEKWQKYSMGVENIQGYYCSWPIKYSPLVAWNGDIVLCCWQPNPNFFKFGNINSENILKIWNNSIYRKIRMRFAKKDVLPECENCKPLGLKK